MIKTKLELCKKCHGLGYVSVCDEKSVRSKTCEDCHGIGCIRVPQTNSDRIRAMSDEELSEYLAELGSEANNGVIYSDRSEEWLEWLKQPAEGEGNEAD